MFAVPIGLASIVALHMPPPMKPSPVWSKLSASKSSNADELAERAAVAVQPLAREPARRARRAEAVGDVVLADLAVVVREAVRDTPSTSTGAAAGRSRRCSRRAARPWPAGSTRAVLQVEHAGRTALVVDLDAERVRQRDDLEVLRLLGLRDVVDVRLHLRVRVAARPAAEPAVRAARLAAVGLRADARPGPGTGASRPLRGRGHHVREAGAAERRQRIRAPARPLEDVPSRVDRALDVAGLARDARRSTRACRSTARARRSRTASRSRSSPSGSRSARSASTTPTRS